MSQPDTVERILDAAETLFADKGFAETSLRQITGRAGVNLAAVNYHFGSKKSLIQAVFARFLDPFCDNLMQALDQRDAQKLPAATLEELLELLIEQSLATQPRSGQDLSIFMRLLGLSFTQVQGHLRRFLMERYGRVWQRYMQLLQASLPEMSKAELFWRLQFMLGAIAFSLSGLQAMREISAAEFSARVSTVQVMQLMLPFLAAGVRAPSAGLSFQPMLEQEQPDA